MQTFITRMAMAILHFSPLTRILCPAHWQILLRFTRMETDQRRYLSCRNISSIDASSSTRFADFHCDATVWRKIVNMRLRTVCGRFIYIYFIYFIIRSSWGGGLDWNWERENYCVGRDLTSMTHDDRFQLDRSIRSYF